MSWLWGNETTEQAQIVVSALQTELDEREGKIKALEAALRREQTEFTRVVQDEVAALEERRKRIEAELAEVNALIKQKQALLKGGKKASKKKSKKEAKSETKSEVSSVKAAEAAGEAAASPATPAAAAKATGAKSKTLPVDKELQKVAKVEPNVAFIIQRSTNSNTVVYAGQLTADKQLDATKPMDVYWIMYEKSGAPREDLNMIERNSAYGVSCAPSKTTKGHYIASLASLKDRECVLFVDEQGQVQARTTINGRKNMLLRRVYVQMTTSWGIPAVDYIEIFGVDPETLESVYEKKANK